MSLKALFRKPLNYKEYWEGRYRKGGNSGSGSYGQLAKFKGDIINKYFRQYAIQNVIEFGCGDGNNLALYKIDKYIGFDVSPTSIKLCKSKFQKDHSKSFFLYHPSCYVNNSVFIADAVISIDVLYHIVDDYDYKVSLSHIFSAARKLIIIYTSTEAYKEELYFKGSHVKHRNVIRDIEKFNWKITKKIPNQYPEKSSANFLILVPR